MDRGVEGAKPPPAAVSWDDKSSSGFDHEASGTNFTLIYSAFSRFNSGFSRFNLLPDRVQDNGNAQTLFNSDQTLINSDKRRATISSCNRLQDVRACPPPPHTHKHTHSQCMPLLAPRRSQARRKQFPAVCRSSHFLDP